jgi:hypothetical protein
MVLHTITHPVFIGLYDQTFEDLVTLVTMDAPWLVDKLLHVISLANIVIATHFFV